MNRFFRFTVWWICLVAPVFSMESNEEDFSFIIDQEIFDQMCETYKDTQEYKKLLIWNNGRFIVPIQYENPSNDYNSNISEFAFDEFIVDRQGFWEQFEYYSSQGDNNTVKELKKWGTTKGDYEAKPKAQKKLFSPFDKPAFIPCERTSTKNNGGNNFDALKKFAEQINVEKFYSNDSQQLIVEQSHLTYDDNSFFASERIYPYPKDEENQEDGLNINEPVLEVNELKSLEIMIDKLKNEKNFAKCFDLFKDSLLKDNLWRNNYNKITAQSIIEEILSLDKTITAEVITFLQWLLFDKN